MKPSEYLETEFNDDWEYTLNCKVFPNYAIERSLSLALQFQIADDLNDLIHSYLISKKDIIKQDYLEKARRYNETA